MDAAGQGFRESEWYRTEIRLIWMDIGIPGELVKAEGNSLPIFMQKEVFDFVATPGER